jgi:hypothetical protein
VSRAAIAAAACVVLAGCGAPPRARTTFLDSVDLVAMTNTMAASFARTEAITDRSSATEPWIISVDRISNFTNQIIPDREKWLYIGRLRARLAESDLARERAITWIIPPERWPMIAEELGVAEAPYGLRLDPTHLLTAEFHALTATTALTRSDTYVCSYQLLALEDGRIVWEDAWEVKRVARGLVFD